MADDRTIVQPRAPARIGPGTPGSATSMKSTRPSRSAGWAKCSAGT